MGSPVSMLLGLREVAGGGAKMNLRDWETDLVAVCGEGDIDVERNHEGELRSPARVKATTDSPSDLIPTAAWQNANWILPGVELLVSISGLEKTSHIFLNLSAAGALAHITSLEQSDILVSESVEVMMQEKHG